jgi:hypothetical protein
LDGAARRHYFLSPRALDSFTNRQCSLDRAPSDERAARLMWLWLNQRTT